MIGKNVSRPPQRTDQYVIKGVNTVDLIGEQVSKTNRTFVVMSLRQRFKSLIDETL